MYLDGAGISLRIHCKNFLVAIRFGEIPVPIPNTTVKPKTAESTILETVWEVRWLPTFFKFLFLDNRIMNIQE